MSCLMRRQSVEILYDPKDLFGLIILDEQDYYLFTKDTIGIFWYRLNTLTQEAHSKNKINIEDKVEWENLCKTMKISPFDIYQQIINMDTELLIYELPGGDRFWKPLSLILAPVWLMMNFRKNGGIDQNIKMFFDRTRVNYLSVFRSVVTRLGKRAEMLKRREMEIASFSDLNAFLNSDLWLLDRLIRRESKSIALDHWKKSFLDAVSEFYGINFKSINEFVNYPRINV